FFGARYVARLINLPSNYLAPLIVFLTVIGSYAIRNNMMDVWIMIFFGLIGYVTKKLGFHPGPIVLGLILGPFAENGLVQSMLIGKASGSILKVFFTRPISVLLIIFCLISIALPIVSSLRESKGKEGVSSV
ncbi:MAG: C4-dicarboxylate ABC transporter permease, partial [Clostridia bacterium]|nr:C4-dicarboxylate ABC transporter permease [Clostridia bacterium]